MKKEKKTPMLGDVYMVQFTGRDHAQLGLRPAVVFQNNAGNRHSPNVIVLPLTTSMKKLGQPTHVVVPARGTGLRYDSVVLCENPVTISKDSLGFYVTTLSAAVMRKIARGYLLATSAVMYLDLGDFQEMKQASVRLNEGVSPCTTQRSRLSS